MSQNMLLIVTEKNTVYYRHCPVTFGYLCMRPPTGGKSHSLFPKTECSHNCSVCLISSTACERSRGPPRFEALRLSCLTTMWYCLWLCKKHWESFYDVLRYLDADWLPFFRRGTFSLTNTEIPQLLYMVQGCCTALHLHISWRGVCSIRLNHVRVVLVLGVILLRLSNSVQHRVKWVHWKRHENKTNKKKYFYLFFKAYFTISKLTLS